ncbi:hypothetical protein GCM10028789_28810 [Sinomonas halotolerans]
MRTGMRTPPAITTVPSAAVVRVPSRSEDGADGADGADDAAAPAAGAGSVT